MTNTLYQNKLSPNAKRVRVLARELGITLEIVELDFTKGEHKSPANLAHNPMGKVPTLVNEHGTFWESPAIMVHLAATAKSPLLPLDAVGLTETTRWTCWNASHFEPGMFTVLFERMFAPMMGRTPDDVKVASGVKDIERYAPVLDKQLTAGPWLTGSQFTIADIALATTVEAGMMAAKDELAPYSNIRAWYGRVMERKSWKD